MKMEKGWLTIGETRNFLLQEEKEWGELERVVSKESDDVIWTPEAAGYDTLRNLILAVSHLEANIDYFVGHWMAHAEYNPDSAQDFEGFEKAVFASLY
jgi:hypothetical protein